MSEKPIMPTPGIERMPRKMAERYFSERTRQLSARIDSLPPAEMLLLALEMLQNGVTPRLVAQVARRAAEKIEAAAR